MGSPKTNQRQNKKPTESLRRFLAAYRRKRALKTACMGGSLGGIAVFSTSLIISKACVTYRGLRGPRNSPMHQRKERNCHCWLVFELSMMWAPYLLGDAVFEVVDVEITDSFAGV